MKTFDFGVFFTDLEGKETTTKLSVTLANLLATKTPGIEPAKAMSWAYDLVKTGTVQIDESDAKTLAGFVKDHNDVFNLFKFQVLKILEGEGKVVPFEKK